VNSNELVSPLTEAKSSGIEVLLQIISGTLIICIIQKIDRRLSYLTIGKLKVYQRIFLHISTSQKPLVDRDISREYSTLLKKQIEIQ
jgi:hypothetical protein